MPTQSATWSFLSIPWECPLTSAHRMFTSHPNAVGTFAGREVRPPRLAHLDCAQAASHQPTLRVTARSHNRRPLPLAQLVLGRRECGRAWPLPPDSVLNHLTPAAGLAPALQLVLARLDLFFRQTIQQQPAHRLLDVFRAAPTLLVRHDARGVSPNSIAGCPDHAGAWRWRSPW
jgi:hypothetical protein